MSPQVIRVAPLGLKDGACEPQPIVLSEFDHLLAGIYIKNVHFFELPIDADRNAIVASLCKGLEHALGQCRIFAGCLQVDEQENRYYVKTSRDSTVALHVVEAEDDYSSYHELRKRHFPTTGLVAAKLLPSVITGDIYSSGDSQEGQSPISAFQLTFINGGLLLGAGVRHCLDVLAIDKFLSIWAQAARDAAIGQPFHPVDPVLLDRTRLIATTKPDAARFQELDGSIAWTIASADSPPPLSLAPPEQTRTEIWHFPASKLDQLKAQASPHVPTTNGGNGTTNGPAWVSTLDALGVFLWECTTRALVQVAEPDSPLLAPDAKTGLLWAVNSRPRFEPPLPPGHLGHAAVLGHIDPQPISSLLSTDDPRRLPRLAAQVRAGVNAVTAQAVNELVEWIAVSGERRNVALDISSRRDMYFTSWKDVTAYTQLDFGFGLPQAVRWLAPGIADGIHIVLPSRAGLVGGDEGLEVCVCLENKAMDCLVDDKVWCEYAEFRG